MLLRLLLALLLLPAAAAAQPYPKFTGLVVDAADVLPPETEAALTAKLEALQRDTKRQFVVATVADMGGRPIDDYSTRLFRAWGIGLKDANNGLLLLLAPREPAGQRGPRVEVGYGLEPVVTDAMAATVIEQDMMPRLRDGDVPAAVTAGTDALIAQLRAAPDEAQARTDAAAATFDRAQPAPAEGGWRDIPVAPIFWLIIIVVILAAARRERRRSGPWGWRRPAGGWDVVLWSVAEELGREARRVGRQAQSDYRSGGSWSSGGSSSSGGGWSGGGFTGGGGGSSGGGGATGRW